MSTKIKFKISDYEKYREILVENYKKHGESKVMETCAGSSIPLVIGYHFLNEKYDGRYTHCIQRLCSFYNGELEF